MADDDRLSAALEKIRERPKHTTWTSTAPGGRARQTSMGDRIFAAMDGAQALVWRFGFRFQWPGWLLNWAWNHQATPWTRGDDDD